MVYGSATADESGPLSWRDVLPIMRKYRLCLEDALETAGLNDTLTKCRSERNEEIEKLGQKLKLPEDKLQKIQNRMDGRAEWRRHGHGTSEGEAADTGHDAEKADRLLLREHIRPIRENYRNCLEKGLLGHTKELDACKDTRREDLAALGLNEDKLEELRAQRRAERSCQVESKGNL